MYLLVSPKVQTFDQVLVAPSGKELEHLKLGQGFKL